MHVSSCGPAATDLPRYIHLLPGAALPDEDICAQRMVVLVEAEVTAAWQTAVSDWIVEKGVLYVIAWGVDCSAWDDAVDWVLLEAFDYGEIPIERFVMTTWHEDETIDEVFWFAKHATGHPAVELTGTALLHIAPQARGDALLSAYASA